ncbi:unnamed protein product [Cercospora beticola]|nr:unnamed protein product [Cercospora beticola]
MAAPNRVFASTLIKTVLIGGRQDGFVEAVENTTLPEDTANAVMKENLHPSEKDGKDHYTVICKDKSGNHLGTVHVYTKKKDEEEEKKA